MIYVDSREPDNIIDQTIKALPECKVKHLLVGDIVCEENSVCIERKEVQDFAGSVVGKKGKKGRIFTQIRNMTENFENNYLIIVGDFNKVHWNKRLHFSLKQFLGAQASIGAREKIPVFHVKNNSQYFTLVKALIQKSDGKKKDLKQVKRIRTRHDNMEVAMIAQIIGQKKAEAVCKKYKMKELYDLKEDDLRSIKGIGKRTAEQLKVVFH